MNKLLEFLENWFEQPDALRRTWQAFGLVIVAITFIVFAGYRMANEIPKQPCDEGSYPFRCYRINKDACMTVWTRAEKHCTDVTRGLDLPPTRLIGPIVFQCQVAMIDKAFGIMRTSEGDCPQKHRELDGWKMRNPDFK